MEEYFSIYSYSLSKFQISLLAFPITVCLIIITYFFLRNSKKRKINNLFSLSPSLENEMKVFRTQPTRLYFHFIQLSNHNKYYKAIYLPSQDKTYDIKGKELIIDYKDNNHPFKYNIAEKICLFADNGMKSFIIVVNKYAENHYNIILDIFENKNKKTFSLEIIIYSRIKKNLEEINKLKNLSIYKKETNLANILRFNIINAREEDLYDIYSINMEKEEKLKINNNFFSELSENLLLNIIYSKDGKIAFRRIFENKKEEIILKFKKEEINALKDLYKNIIKKYINSDPEDDIIINNFKNDFISFDKKHGYTSNINKENNKKINIESDLRNANNKF